MLSEEQALGASACVNKRRNRGMRNKGEDEECRRGEPDESELERGRLRRKLIEKALAQFPPPEPQPSKEEVESVFRSVTASY